MVSGGSDFSGHALRARLHQRVGPLRGFITTLSKELNDSELLRCSSLVGALNLNFYENWLTAEMTTDYAEVVKSLVEKLKRLAR